MIIESAAFLPRLPTGGGRRRGAPVCPLRGPRSCLCPARPRSRCRPSPCPARLEVLQVFVEHGLARFQDAQPSALYCPSFCFLRRRALACRGRAVMPCREHAGLLSSSASSTSGETGHGGGRDLARRQAQPGRAAGARAADKGWAGRRQRPRTGARNCTGERFYFLLDSCSTAG